MATDKDLREAEARLGLQLPRSYRDHLLSGAGIDGDHGLSLLPPSQIDQFSRREPEWLAAWMDGYRSYPTEGGSVTALADDPSDPATMAVDQLGGAIVISTTEDGRVLLLNPARLDATGEWEAWDFAWWYPGALRHPTFGDMVAALAGSGRPI